MSSSYELYQFDQVLSLLNDQLECLTIKSVMLELGAPRGVARQVLEDVAKQWAQGNQGKQQGKYEVVRMVPRTVIENGVKKTTMQLIHDSECTYDENAKGTVFSIAPKNGADDAGGDDATDKDGSFIQVLSTAHEKALATQRDRSLENDGAELFGIFDVCQSNRDDNSSDSNGCIMPAPELLQENDEGVKIIRRVKRGRGATSAMASTRSDYAPAKGGNKGTMSNSLVGGNKSNGVASSGGSGKVQKQKATTAAAFFGSSKGSSKNTSSSQRTNSTSEKKSSKPQNATDAREDAMDVDNEEKKMDSETNAKSDKQAGNVDNVVNVGNADDFEGDIDEDDDFLQDDKARKARNASAARKQARDQMTDENLKRRMTSGLEGRRSKIAPEKRRKNANSNAENAENAEGGVDSGDGANELNEENDDEDVDVAKKEVKGRGESSGKENHENVRGMDAKNATVTGKNSNGKSSSTEGPKKRRKKLVEQTTMDANGYIRTETVTVWEDVPDDDVDEAKETKASSQRLGGHGKGAKIGSSSSSSTKKAGSKPKKQAGLMGFFAKKK